MTAEQPKFRQAVISDIPGIMEIRVRVRENILTDPSLVTTQLCEDYLHRLGRGWVAGVNEEIAGFSFAASADSSIWALFVLPGYEGRGVGGGLLKLAVDWLFEQGNQEITLSTEKGTRADRFYLHQGWQRREVKDDVEVYYSLRHNDPSQN